MKTPRNANSNRGFTQFISKDTLERGTCARGSCNMGRTECADLSLFSSASLPSEMIRSATPFPLVSLFFMFIGFILSNIGHVRPHRTILAFVSGIFFILSGEFCWARFSLGSPPFPVISSTISQFLCFTCHSAHKGSFSPNIFLTLFLLGSPRSVPGGGAGPLHIQH